MKKLSNEKALDKANEEKFEQFLFHCDDYLENIIERAKNQGYIFDYSFETLKDIENYINKSNTTIEDDDYNDLSAYLGEVVRLKYGGKWACCLDKKNNSLYYGFPVIDGHSAFDVVFSPFHLIKAYILRKKPNLFSEAIENQVNPKQINW